jgi:hypothetical protein
MEDIQGSEGSWYGFMTTNAMTFGPDLLMIVPRNFQPAAVQKLAWPGTLFCEAPYWIGNRKMSPLVHTKLQQVASIGRYNLRLLFDSRSRVQSHSLRMSCWSILKFWAPVGTNYKWCKMLVAGIKNARGIFGGKRYYCERYFVLGVIFWRQLYLLSSYHRNLTKKWRLDLRLLWQDRQICTKKQMLYMWLAHFKFESRKDTDSFYLG